MMLTITLNTGDEWGCLSLRNDKIGGGVFFRDPKNRAWRQFKGVHDTPIFKSAQHFSRYVHRNFREADGALLGRMVSHTF